MMYNIGAGEAAVLDARRVKMMKTKIDRATWEIWKDGFVSKFPYRMMTPIGVIAFRIKRHADLARAEYERCQSRDALVRS